MHMRYVLKPYVPSQINFNAYIHGYPEGRCPEIHKNEKDE